MKVGNEGKNKVRHSKISKIIFWIALAVIGILSIIYDSPSATSKNHQTALPIVVNLIITGIVAYFSVLEIKSKKRDIFTLLFAALLVLYIWTKLFLPPKVIINISALIMVISLAYAVFKYLKRGESKSLLTGVSIYFSLNCIMQATSFSPTENESILFYALPAIFSVVCCAVAIVLILKNKYLKDIDLSEKFALAFLVLLLSAAISFCLLNNLNYSLETTEPQIKSGVIVDARINSGYRSITAFYLTVKIDGKEIEIDVPSNEYYSNKIGSSYQVYYHEGFFKEPFYACFK